MGYCQEERLPWHMAGNIGARLALHRQILGLSQELYGRLFGRGWKQVSAWENGHSKPRPSVISRAASQNGWPLEMFEEGGPMPYKTPTSPVEARSDIPTDVEVWEMTRQRTKTGRDVPVVELLRLVELALKARRTSVEEPPPSNGDGPGHA